MIDESNAVSRTGVEGDHDLNPVALLTAIKAARAAEDVAAARQLALAARWADLHPPESVHSGASFTVSGCEHDEPIAGDGCPSVAEFCVAELGSVLGASTASAKRLIGHALELRHRLPRLWRQVQSGAVPAWRARSVAEATIHTTPSLTPEAAGWVDSQVAAVAGRIGPAQLDRLVAETIKRFDLAEHDPAADPEDGWQHVDPRHATVDTGDVHFAGTLHVEADLDLADALDLDRALAHGAAVQKALGSADSLDARRAKALGDLARAQTALDLHSQGHAGATDHGGLPAARQVVLHAHFDASDDGGAIVFGPTGRLEEGQRLVLLDQLRDWCADSRTTITIKPVVDLNTHLAARGYAVPDRIREHVVLRDGTCVFPWCTRPARGCDVDHVVEHDHTADADGRPQRGPTSSDNLAALCRFHHRLKTHSRWRYEVTEPGAFEWTSPHGHRYRRDGSGTVATRPTRSAAGSTPAPTMTPPHTRHH